MKEVGMCPPPLQIQEKTLIDEGGGHEPTFLQIQEKNLIDEGRGHVPTFFQN